MTADQIKKMIESGLEACSAQVKGDDGVHFEATVICPRFEGKSTLQRHRMVYQTLGELMGREIHALTLTTRTPDEDRA